MEYSVASSTVNGTYEQEEDGASEAYNGYDEEGVPVSGQARETLGDWLVRAFSAEQNEDSALVALAPLSSGNKLQIETNGERVRLALVP